MATTHKITSQKQKGERAVKKHPTSILAVDIGGSKIKVLATNQTEPRKMRSGKRLTPTNMVKAVRELADGWDYDVVSIGYPGMVGAHGPRSEPGNLGPGWVGFNFAAAFGLPVRVINDAAMQALGSYEGGRMLFLGLGTGLGSTLIADHVIIPLELGHLLYKDGQTLGDLLGARGFKRLGQKAWSRIVGEVVPMLMNALLADHVVVSGGNAKKLKPLPVGVRLGNNLTAFRGGFRLWNLKDVPTLLIDDHHSYASQAPVE
jgi:polyphosphate glucokinase